MSEKTVQAISAMFERLDSYITAEDFANNFKAVIDTILAIEKKWEKLNLERQQEFDGRFDNLQSRIEEINQSENIALREDISAQAEKMFEDARKALNFVYERAQIIKSGDRGEPGLPGLPGPQGEPGPAGSPDTPAQIVLKLESLTGDNRLDKSAIKGIQELEEKAAKNVTMYGGSRGIDISVDGVQKGLAQYVNLIAGTGITLTPNFVGARLDITIDASASGGGLSVLTATGAIDDSNKTFTFVSAPTLVVVNGTAYRDGHGVSIVGTTATLDNPAGTGGDVYGLG